MNENEVSYRDNLIEELKKLAPLVYEVDKELERIKSVYVPRDYTATHIIDLLEEQVNALKLLVNETPQENGDKTVRQGLTETGSSPETSRPKKKGK